MPDVGARKPAATNHAVTRDSRPARFDEQLPDPGTEREEPPDHRRISVVKAMLVVSRNLNAGATTIGIAGEQLARVHQPLNTG